MEHGTCITDFHIQLDRDSVFDRINCYSDSPIYDQLLEEYGELEKKLILTIDPQAYYQFGVASQYMAVQSEGTIAMGTPILTVMITLGERISDLIDTYIEGGDYLLGILIDAMADDYLFQMDDQMTDQLNKVCHAHSMGINERLEAPLGVPMQMQQVILQELKPMLNQTIEITKGYMFKPVKTLAYILVLSQDTDKFYHGHDCSKCNVINCKRREIL